jgi:hypothetical protein
MKMNSGRLWRWSPDKESLITLSSSLKDLSCSQLSRYPALLFIPEDPFCYITELGRNGIFNSSVTGFGSSATVFGSSESWLFGFSA